MIFFSCGDKIVKDGYQLIDVEKVPKGVVLLLKKCNWTGLSPERIFTYKAGSARWE